MKFIFLLFLCISVFSSGCKKRAFQSGERSRASSALRSAETVIYPGSFDPFHKTHFAEVKAALTIYNAKKLFVMPVESAYYFPPIKGTTVMPPRLLNFMEREKLIRELFRSEANVDVSPLLQNIESNVFESITKSARALNSTHILAGTDVINTWSGLDGFEEFSKNFNFIITEDANDLDLSQELKERLKGDRFDFIPVTFEPIRSRELHEKVLQGGNDISSYFPVANLSPEIETMIQKAGARYAEAIDHYLSTSFSAEILPELSKRIDPKLLKLWQADQDIVGILKFMDLRQGSILGSVISRTYLQSAFSTLDKNIRNHLTKTLYPIFNSGPIGKLYSRNSYFAAMRENSQGEADAKAKTHALLRVSQRFFSHIEGPFFRFAQLRLAQPLQQLFNPLLQFNLPHGECETGQAADGDFNVLVYRGVSDRKSIDEMITSWKAEGMLSKLALSHRLKNATVEDAVKASQEVFKSKGPQNSVLDHYLGNWKTESVFVATSLDKGVAARFAGKGGYLLTASVPASLGFFLNDLAYWEGTQWQKEGSPAFNQQEFAVLHHLTPSHILSIERIETDMPESDVSIKWSKFANNYIKVLASKISESFASPLACP